MLHFPQIKMAQTFFVISVVVALLSFVDFSYQEDDHAAFIQKMHALEDECVKESGVDKDLPRKAFHDGDFPEDKNLKCYFKCMFEKMGEMDASGNVDFAALEQHLPPNVDKAKAMETLNKCKDKKSSDPCQTAFDVAKCMREIHELMKHD